jgi:hypothetical protein
VIISDLARFASELAAFELLRSDRREFTGSYLPKEGGTSQLAL